MSKNLRIVFLGTPDFAVASLKALVKAHLQVVAVVTAPDKPAGRGMKLKPSPVKLCALELGIPVLQPTNLKDPEFIEQLRSFEADIQVVIAFRMLPEVVWNMPPLGTINLHASLLPDYRGAAPINRAIMNGETVTGVTTFRLKHEIDTGDMLMQVSVPIGPETTAGELHDTLMAIGSETIVNTIQQIQNNAITPIPQPETSVKTAPKVFTKDCIIDWNTEGNKIYNLVRGLCPYPGAITTWDERLLKVYEVRFEQNPAHTENTGIYFTDYRTYIKFSCLDGFIYLQKIQPEGKKIMDIRSFLNGYQHP